MRIPTSRRSFFKQTAVLSAAGMLLPVCASATPMQTKVPDRLRILFQGDSITDAGRDRFSGKSNDFHLGMGSGYALMAASSLWVDHPSTDLHYYNRGVSGDKVFQLSRRWQEDCFDIQPDVLSVHIGVNDFWHTITNGYEGTVATYKKDFLELLQRTQVKFPKLKFIIGEPFVVIGGTAINEAEWIPAFRAYQAAAAQVAQQFDAAWIPYQKIFDDAVKLKDVPYWCPDGVHPSIQGCVLMAKAWKVAFDSLY